jgi:hypothetical protein
MGVPKSQVSIGTNDVTINLNMNLNVDKENDKVSITNHKVTISSSLGDLYNSAVKIYNYEQTNLFLENYSIDALRSYAPVDGVEISCSPKIWSAEDVFTQLKQGIEANTLALRTNGNSKDYFNLKLPVSQNVRFLNSQNWTNTFEVNPSQGAALVSNPVGTQAGLGILGFCYVPYHYVYNMKYPVLVQIYEGSEIFQFPMAVVVQGNQPRQPYDVTAVGTNQDTGMCDYANTPVEIRTFDTSSNPILTNVSYQCVGQICNIGQTSSDGVLDGKFPQCVNGVITATAEGYKENDFIYSTIQGGNADLILQKLYNVGVNLKVDGANYNNKAIITFTTDNSSDTIIYPEQNSIQLSEGQYKVQVYIYSQSNLNLGPGTYQQCVPVLSGITGMLGITQQNCFDVTIPSQVISNVLSGGGQTDYYISESELQSGTIQISAQSLPTPTTIDQLQSNYLSFENKGLDVSFT